MSRQYQYLFSTTWTNATTTTTTRTGSATAPRSSYKPWWPWHTEEMLKVQPLRPWYAHHENVLRSNNSTKQEA